MQGSSRAARIASQEALDGALQQHDPAELGEDLLAVSGVVGSNVVLLRAVADPSREGKDKAALVARLFGGKISAGAQQVAEAVAAQRWAAEVDLARTLEDLGVDAVLVHAERADRLGRVEDELFRFNRIVAGTPQLREAITDPRGTVAAKGELVERLLDGKAAPETIRLAKHAVGAGRRRRYDRAIEGILALADRRKRQLTATVTSAISLSQEQVDRLTAALTAQYDRAIHTNLIVDPRVVGGVRIEVAGEVIDGTILTRLQDARRGMAG